MLSRLSPHCARVASQGSLFHQCIRRTFPKESRTPAAQRAFTTSRYQRAISPEFWTTTQDDWSEIHWNRVAKLSQKKSLYSKREMEYQMSIIQFIEARKELLQDRWGLRALVQLGYTRAWLSRLYNLYENTRVAGDRMLAYTNSSRTLPSYIKYTTHDSSYLALCRFTVPVCSFSGTFYVVFGVIMTLILSIYHGRFFPVYELPGYDLPFPADVAWDTLRYIISRLRGEETKSWKVQYATPTQRDLEQTA